MPVRAPRALLLLPPVKRPPLEAVPFQVDERAAVAAFCKWAEQHGAESLDVAESMRQQRLVAKAPGPGAGFRIEQRHLPFWSFTASAVVTDAGAARAHAHKAQRAAAAAAESARDTFEAEAAARAARASSSTTASAIQLQTLLYAGYDLPRSAAEVVKTAIGAEPYPLDASSSPPEFALPELSAAWPVARGSLYQAAGPGRQLKLLRARRLLLPSYDVRYQWGGIPGVSAPEYRAVVSGVTGGVDGVMHTPPWERYTSQAIAGGKEIAERLIETQPKGLDVAVRLGLNFLTRAGSRLGPLGIAALVLAPFVAKRILPAAQQAYQDFQWKSLRDDEIYAWQSGEPGWRDVDYANEEWELLGQGHHPGGNAGGGPADVYNDARTVDWADPYSVLGLDPAASLRRADLQVALRRELLRWHPDHNAGDGSFASERTKRILSAYHALRPHSS